MNRREFIAITSGAAAVAAAVSSLGLLAAPVPLHAASPRPRRVTPADAFDPEMEAFMRPRQIPGGALAVVRHGRIVYSRGYGWADRENGRPARPESLFRIASVSKPITTVAILRLIEERRLSLDARVLDLLPVEPLLDEGRPPDARLPRITVRHLLHHTGGWDRDKSFDPMFRSKEIAARTGTRPPADTHAIIRYMLGRPLDFDPGTRYAYSNFGYCLLGRIIERITGRPYETFVRDAVLAPAGIHRMRLGASVERGRTPGEVRYYTADSEQVESLFPDTPPRVPMPYGGFCLEAMDAHGGWIASVIDLARFAAALQDRDHSSLLRPSSFSLLTEPPAPPVSRKADGSLEDHYYACGWMTRPAGPHDEPTQWHSGSLPGTATLLVRRWDGLAWVALFNRRSEDQALPNSAIDPALHRAAEAVNAW